MHILEKFQSVENFQFPKEGDNSFMFTLFSVRKQDIIQHRNMMFVFGVENVIICCVVL